MRKITYKLPKKYIPQGQKKEIAFPFQGVIEFELLSGTERTLFLADYSEALPNGEIKEDDRQTLAVALRATTKWAELCKQKIKKVDIVSGEYELKSLEDVDYHPQGMEFFNVIGNKILEEGHLGKPLKKG